MVSLPSKRPLILGELSKWFFRHWLRPLLQKRLSIRIDARGSVRLDLADFSRVTIKRNSRWVLHKMHRWTPSFPCHLIVLWLLCNVLLMSRILVNLLEAASALIIHCILNIGRFWTFNSALSISRNVGRLVWPVIGAVLELFKSVFEYVANLDLVITVFIMLSPVLVLVLGNVIRIFHLLRTLTSFS